ncbi:MAG: helix-turn-helix transcriptional regulator [Candidatus Brocadiia bacterium]
MSDRQEHAFRLALTRNWTLCLAGAELVYEREDAEASLPLTEAIRAGLLSDLRRARGQTQAELAEGLGVTRATVAKWRAGEHAPGLSSRHRIEGYILGLRADGILGRPFQGLIVEPISYDFGPARTLERARLLNRLAAHLPPGKGKEELLESAASYRRIIDEREKPRWAEPPAENAAPARAPEEAAEGVVSAQESTD